MEINELTNQDDLLKIINDPNTPDALYEQASREHRRRLLAKKHQEEAQEERIREAVAQVHGLKVSFEKFVETRSAEGNSAFEESQIKAYSIKKGWSKIATVKPETTAEPEEEEKQPIIVGKFKLADYGFKMPTRKKTNTPFSTATEFEWNFNRQYAGTSWELKFINILVEKGLDDLEKHLTKEFKDWLEVCTVPTKGPFSGKSIYKNKRKFYKRFGLDENKHPIKA